MDVSGFPQILPAGHQRDTLERIVVRHTQMIAGGRVLSRQHDVAEPRRIGGDRPPPLFLERQGAIHQVQGTRHVQPQHETFSRGDARGRVKAAADTWIQRRTVRPMRCACGLARDIGPGAEARVQQPA